MKSLDTNNLPRRILIVRNDALGDLISSFPLVGILKTMWPDCEIYYLVNPVYSELVLNLEGVHGIFEFPAKYKTKNKALNKQKKIERKLQKAELIKKLKKTSFYLAIVLYASFENALIVSKSSIPNRLGTGRRFYSFLFNLKRSESKKLSLYHESVYSIRLLLALNTKKKANFALKKRFSSIIKKSDEKELMGFMSVLKVFANENKSLAVFLNNSLNSSFIIIHPMKTLSSLKWPISAFKELIKLILNDQDLKNFKIVLTGTAPEKEDLLKLKAEFNSNSEFTNRIHIFSDLTLNELSFLYTKASLWIGNSTGPMHLASYLSTPVLALFAKAPAFCAKRWGPVYHNNSIVLEPDIPVCNRCIAESCEFFNCLSIISSNMVLEKLKGALSLPIR